MRKCNRCHKEKRLTSFFRNKGLAKGRAYTCKVCIKAMGRAWSKTPRARLLSAARRKRYNQSAKGRAWRRKFQNRPDQRRKARERQLRNRNTVSGRYREFDCLLRRSYGIDVETWAHMYNDQNRCCASCGDQIGVDKRTHVDHDHKTSRVRGLLCQHCNIALGGAKDSSARLRRLIKYLEKNR